MVSHPDDILVLIGTRPEAIKLAPVVAALRDHPDRFRVRVCLTGQHRELLDQMLDLFELEPEIDLDLMAPNQSLSQLASRALEAVDGVVQRLQPDRLVVQGDTTTAMIGALAAFHRHVPVAHVEAGLRSGDLRAPFPEEANRRIIDLLADALFAPTQAAADRLLAEGVPDDRVFVTGNTVVDALQHVAAGGPPPEQRDEVLVTIHRRESFGEPLRGIFKAVRELAHAYPAMRWIYPVHPNPNVAEPAQELLGDVPNVELRAPMGYAEFLGQLQSARLTLTDSGGVQEEAPTFRTPVIVLRDKTERTEGIEAGVALLAGTAREQIVRMTSALLEDPAAYARMARAGNPYGDGAAGARIAAILRGAPWEPFQPCADPPASAS